MFERVAYSTDIAEFVLISSLLRDNEIEVLDMMRARRQLTDSEFKH